MDGCESPVKISNDVKSLNLYTLDAGGAKQDGLSSDWQGISTWSCTSSHVFKTQSKTKCANIYKVKEFALQYGSCFESEKLS